MNNEYRKNLLYIALLIVLLGGLLIGATVAYFLQMDQEENDATRVYTGTMEVFYEDGSLVDNPLLYPIEDPLTRTDERSYRKNFSVTTSGSLDQKVTINFEITNNEFANNIIKYALFNDSEVKVASGLLPTTGTITMVNNVLFNSNQTVNYTLVLWLSENNTNQNDQQNKNLTGTIKINSVQVNN